MDPVSEPLATTFLSRADGSAEWLAGSTRIIASVSGPMEVPRRDELPILATLEVVVQPDIGVSGTREQALQEQVRRALIPVVALDMHPRTLIQVVVQIVQATADAGVKTRPGIAQAAVDMDVLSGAINVAFLALLDAGVAMRATISACALILPSSSSAPPLLNPTTKSLLTSPSPLASAHAIAYEVKGGVVGRLLLCESVGTFTPTQLFSCLDTAAETCAATNDTVRALVARNIAQCSKWAPESS
ncbi:ribosomal protein S5 domain 2-type protein [Limtongia smithiae]|uniref:ribosomal protein S5 domain 2-type protein n=1 Tax=Limtongia smithiae TaxID=1125753 RepID=UPI0034CDC61C